MTLFQDTEDVGTTLSVYVRDESPSPGLSAVANTTQKTAAAATATMATTGNRNAIFERATTSPGIDIRV